MITFALETRVRAITMGIVALTAIGRSNPSHAQDGPFTTPPSIGVVAGLSSAKVAFTGEGVSLTFDARTGITAGISLIQRLNPKVSLEIDGLYVQKGFKVSSGGESASMSVDYLEVPVLARYQFGTSATGLFLTGGVAFASKAKCTGGISAPGISVTEGCGESVNAWDYGPVLGGGIHVRAISGSIRYFHGQANIIDDPDLDSRNRVFMLILGYRLSGS